MVHQRAKLLEFNVRFGDPEGRLFSLGDPKDLSDLMQVAKGRPWPIWITCPLVHPLVWLFWQAQVIQRKRRRDNLFRIANIPHSGDYCFLQGWHLMAQA